MKINNMMQINKKVQKQNSISIFYRKAKQAYEKKKVGFCWLAPLLLVAQEIQPSDIIINIAKDEFYQLLHILNEAVADMIVMYKKNITEEVYRLLHVSRVILDLNPRSRDHGLLYSFKLVMYKVHFNSTLALLLVKNRQYSAAFECFEYVLEIVKNEIVDTKSDIFLVAISNYVTFVKSYQNAEGNRKFIELINYLQRIYQNLLNKYILNGFNEQSILILLQMYRMHELYLKKNYNMYNKLLIKKYIQIYKKSNNYINQHFMNKINKKYKINQIQIRRKEINFFHIPKYFNNHIKKNKIQINSKNKTIQINSKKKIERVIQFKHQIHTNYKKSQNSVQKNQKIIQTIDCNDLKSNTVMKCQKSIQLQKKKLKKIYNKFSNLSMKINYTIIQVMSQGIVLSDFLKQKRKFLTWFEVFLVIKNLRYSQIFMHCLPICCFYDVCKIFSNYIYKNDQFDKMGVMILDKPKELVELSAKVKLFYIDGRYLKAFIIKNQNEIELAVDWYLQEFEKYFKVVCHDEYIQKFNGSIFRREQWDERVYTMQNYKKRENIKQRLSVQFKLEQLLKVEKVKDYEYKIILMMNNNKQMLIGYTNTNISNLQYLLFDVIEFNNNCQHINILYVPLYKIRRYFIIDDKDIVKWLLKFGKYIVEAYLESFKDYPTSFHNLQCYQVITYAKKIEMTHFGKYMTPIIGELIGSKTRIWGLCLRFYEISSVKQQITFIYNPYFQLLKPLINLTEQQRKTTLIDLLYEGSVVKTHKKLMEWKLNGSMVNMIDYWQLINF